MCWDTDEIILDLFVTLAFPFVFSENRILIPSWQSLSNASFKWCRQRVLSLKFSLKSGLRDMKFSWIRVCWPKTSKIVFKWCYMLIRVASKSEQNKQVYIHIFTLYTQRRYYMFNIHLLARVFDRYIQCILLCLST